MDYTKAADELKQWPLLHRTNETLNKALIAWVKAGKDTILIGVRLDADNNKWHYIVRIPCNPPETATARSYRDALLIKALVCMYYGKLDKVQFQNVELSAIECASDIEKKKNNVIQYSCLKHMISAYLPGRPKRKPESVDALTLRDIYTRIDNDETRLRPDNKDQLLAFISNMMSDKDSNMFRIMNDHLNKYAGEPIDFTGNAASYSYKRVAMLLTSFEHAFNNIRLEEEDDAGLKRCKEQMRSITDMWKKLGDVLSTSNPLIH